ncbi:MAG: C15orf41 family protein [Methanolobus sp.]|uniref:C15orf41 family protein n=1 Tax=Methanolobus sp. TaxID=1874737 RepID=UPI002730E4C5|nr:C15orf41 family protein [Methanolobus sp.]MDP2218395.1 C15orf41 family protein [Methanolobus sp.]
MDINTYEQIFSSLKGVDDIDRVSEMFSQPVGVIYSILNQKTVTDVKKNFSRVQDRSGKHLSMWQKGTTIVQIARKNSIPATLMAAMILSEMGIPKKSFMKNIDELPDMRLKKEVKEAMCSDHFFSPRAHEVHTVKGKMGESILEQWLANKGVSFRTENDLRALGIAKTPDFLLEEPLDINGKNVSWIESKALFGDEKEHQYYMKKQFTDYEENFGTGMIVYWYGFLDSVKMDGHLIKDYRFFVKESDTIDELLNHGVQW